jgi:hypothetical protein
MQLMNDPNYSCRGRFLAALSELSARQHRQSGGLPRIARLSSEPLSGEVFNATRLFSRALNRTADVSFDRREANKITKFESNIAQR